MRKFSKRVTIFVAVFSSIFVLLAGGILTITLWPEPEFYIYNLGVDIAPYDDDPYRADNFHDNEHFYGFFCFGYDISETKPCSCFEYMIDKNASVYSPCDGVIKRIEYQPETNDYSILIVSGTLKSRLDLGTYYKIDVDHVTNIKVKSGDKVKVGQILGNPGPWEGNIGRVEIDIINNKVHYAPFQFCHPTVKTRLEQKISKLMSDIETRYGDPNIYDEARMIGAGSYLKEIPESIYH